MQFVVIIHVCSQIIQWFSYSKPLVSTVIHDNEVSAVLDKAIFNTRTPGGGRLISAPPPQVFADNAKTAARSAAAMDERYLDARLAVGPFDVSDQATDRRPPSGQQMN